MPDSFQTALIPIILVANTICIVKTHLLYIVVSGKDKALMHWLATNSHISSASVIKIRDAHWIEYPFEHKEDIFRPAYLSCMVKRIWPSSRILAVLDNWGSSSGRSLTPEEIEQVLEATTIRYSFAPQVQRGSQYQVTIAAPSESFDAPKVYRAFEAARDVNPSKQTAMVRMALEYLYLKWFSSRRLDKLFEKHFSISASDQNCDLTRSAPIEERGMSSGLVADAAADDEVGTLDGDPSPYRLRFSSQTRYCNQHVQENP